jgi:hypothetical protein
LNLTIDISNVDLLLVPFLELFVIQDPLHTEKCYSFTALMTVLFIMSKSPTDQKAKAIFRVYDHECSGVLGKDVIKEIVGNIYGKVRAYSEIFSELDNFKLAAQKPTVDKLVIL